MFYIHKWIVLLLTGMIYTTEDPPHEDPFLCTVLDHLHIFCKSHQHHQHYVKTKWCLVKCSFFGQQVWRCETNTFLHTLKIKFQNNLSPFPKLFMQHNEVVGQYCSLLLCEALAVIYCIMHTVLIKQMFIFNTFRVILSRFGCILQTHILQFCMLQSFTNKEGVWGCRAAGVVMYCEISDSQSVFRVVWPGSTVCLSASFSLRPQIPPLTDRICEGLSAHVSCLRVFYFRFHNFLFNTPKWGWTWGWWCVHGKSFSFFNDYLFVQHRAINICSWNELFIQKSKWVFLFYVPTN